MAPSNPVPVAPKAFGPEMSPKAFFCRLEWLNRGGGQPHEMVTDY